MPQPANNLLDIDHLPLPPYADNLIDIYNLRGDEDRSEVPAEALGECEPEEPKQGPPPDNEIDPLLVAVANREDPNLGLSGKHDPLPPCATN